MYYSQVQTAAPLYSTFVRPVSILGGLESSITRGSPLGERMRGGTFEGDPKWKANKQPKKSEGERHPREDPGIRQAAGGGRLRGRPPLQQRSAQVREARHRSGRRARRGA